MYKCSKCKRQMNECKIVWITTRKNTVIRNLCQDCIDELKYDKTIIKYEIKWGDRMKKLVYAGKINNVLAMLKLDITLAKLNQRMLQGEQKPLLKTYLENTKIF